MWWLIVVGAGLVVTSLFMLLKPRSHHLNVERTVIVAHMLWSAETLL